MEKEKRYGVDPLQPPPPQRSIEMFIFVNTIYIETERDTDRVDLLSIATSKDQSR